MQPNYYKGKVVLVTGASGFIGSALINALLNLEVTIIRITRDLKSLPTISGSARVVDAQYSELLSRPESVLTLCPNVIFALGAQTSGSVAASNPRKDLVENVGPIVELLSIVEKHCPTAAFVHTGTVTQVGLTKDVLVTEEEEDSPATIYDLHKLVVEDYVKYYSRSCGISATTLRLANVYGPTNVTAAPGRGVLNQVIKQAINGNDIYISGNGQRLRDYIFIDDVIDALLLAGIHIKELAGKHFIICVGESHTILSTFESVKTLVESTTGKEVSLVPLENDGKLSPIEDRNFVGNSAAFRKITGWVPQYSLIKGLQKTIKEFHREKPR